MYKCGMLLWGRGNNKNTFVNLDIVLTIEVLVSFKGDYPSTCVC